MDVEKIVKEIKKGNLVIIPTDTVYGISADMNNEKAIEKVFGAKQRDKNKPLILLASNLEMLKKYVKKISPLEEKIIKKYMPGRLTMLFLKNEKVSDLVSAGSSFVGIRIPDDPNLIKIINKVGNPIISTSANISGENTVTNVKNIDKKLLKYVSYVEDAGIIESFPSTVIKVEDDEITILRKGDIALKIVKDGNFKIRGEL